MFYRLLGMAVWKAGKFYLSAKLPRRKVAGLVGLTALALGGLLVASRRGGGNGAE
jgi:hypothetical protein